MVLAVLAWYMLPGTGEPNPVSESVSTLQPEPEPVVDDLPDQQQEVVAVAASLPVLLDNDWLDLQNEASWPGLAALWNEPAGGDAIRTACRDGNSLGWACLKAEGSLARIAQLGLPVVLQLQGDSPQLLLLQGIDGTRLLVGAPETSLTVSRQAVEDRWFGAYVVAWPQAANWPREIARGDTGPAVETVLDLARIADKPYTGQAVFELEFEHWLVEFQQRFGLDADGIVGPRTLLYLIRPSISEPGLETSWPEEV